MDRLHWLVILPDGLGANWHGIFSSGCLSFPLSFSLPPSAGTIMTPNYVSNSSTEVSQWCNCEGSGNQWQDCLRILHMFNSNTCLREYPRISLTEHLNVCKKECKYGTVLADLRFITDPIKWFNINTFLLCGDIFLTETGSWCGSLLELL